MLQVFITKYGLAAHLAFLVVAPLFLNPSAVIWLTALCAIWFLMGPSRIGRETLHEARARVAGATARDPLFWTLAALVAVAGIRFANGGVALAYDAEKAVWSVTYPSFRLLPGSVDGAGFEGFSCAAAILVAVTAVRHALGRSARFAFLFAAAAMSGVLAATLAILYAMGSESAAEAVRCSIEKPSYSGAAFGVYLCCGLSGLLAAFEHRWLKAMPLAFFAVGANALGLFVFAPPFVQCLFAAAALVAVGLAFAYARIRMPAGSEFKYLAVCGLLFAFAAATVGAILPPAVLEARLAPYTTGEFLPPAMLAARKALASVSLEIWKSNPWFGGGLGSFPLELGYFARPEDWKAISPVQTAPLGAHWMILSERGVVGAFCIAAPVVLLLVDYFRNLATGVRAGFPHPAAWSGVLVFAAAVAESMIAVSFLSPGMMTAAAAVLAVSANAFPKRRSRNG